MAKRAAKRKPSRAVDAASEKSAFQIVKPEQLRAMVSPRRGEIMDVVAGPMSVKEIADAIGVAPSSLYYHIEHLCSVGLLREAGVRQTVSKPEQLYDVPARRMRFLKALQEPRNKRVLNALVASICKQANRDFSRGVNAPHRKTSGARRNTRFGRLVARPDTETMEQINAHLDAVTELLAASAAGDGERVAFSWVMSPAAPRARRR